LRRSRAFFFFDDEREAKLERDDGGRLSAAQATAP